MIDRRLFLGTGAAAALGAGALPLLAGGPALAAAPQPGITPPPSGLTPAQALALLKEGNRRFVAGMPTGIPIGAGRRQEIAQSQAPFAVIVACSDSRVGPEQLFARGLGELFVVRNAGNTAASDQALGSIEYAVAELKSPLIVVLGHERCGAVAAAAAVVRDNARFPGSIDRLVQPIIPAVLAVREQAGDDMLTAAIHQNVREVVRHLRTESGPLIEEPVEAGRVMVVGAYYDLDSGIVRFFDD